MAVSLLAQPAIAGAFGYVGSRFILGNEGNLSVSSYSIDKNLAMGGMITASSLVANVSKDYIIPKIPIVDPVYKGYAQVYNNKMMI